MPSILIVERDKALTRAVSGALDQAGYDVWQADCGRVAIAIVTRSHPHVALIDLDLPDVCGLGVLEELLLLAPGATCIMMSSEQSRRVTVQAMRLGAWDFLDKPLSLDELIPYIDRLVRKDHTIGCVGDPRFSTSYAADRCVSCLLRGLDSPHDLPTVATWARYIATSVGALRNWHHTAALRPKATLTFLRVLRALLHHQRTGAPASQLLDIVDSRTISKVMRLGHTSTPPRSLAMPVDEFLKEQRWIRDEYTLSTIQLALEKRGVLRSNGLRPPFIGRNPHV